MTDTTPGNPFPLVETDGYAARNIQTKLTPEEAADFKRLTEGLRAAHAQLPGGKHVDSNADVVRYLIAYAVEHGDTSQS